MKTLYYFMENFYHLSKEWINEVCVLFLYELYISCCFFLILILNMKKKKNKAKNYLNWNHGRPRSPGPDQAFFLKFIFIF